jgi:UDP-N-acetyl-D-mannosaminuronic acid dehydrogenase
MTDYEFDVCVVGGCGHVGLPLAATFATSGLNVAIYDINDAAIAIVQAGKSPFMEPGVEQLLQSSAGRTLTAANDPSLISRSRHVIVIVGTPVDEHLNPTFYSIRRFFVTLEPHLRDGQCVILRSTVFPGTTDRVHRLLTEAGRKIHVAFCPERVAEGRALEELKSLPQIVAGCDSEAVGMSMTLFRTITSNLIELQPLEAELTKIFANSWRYIQFAAANQFFMIAAEYGLDFYRIYDALTRDYPRMAGLPRSGFAAGPCLFKDTMQLAAANNNNFYLGHAAMLVNEGLPNFIVRQLKKTLPLHKLTVGVLGMAFKAESDDSRDSLSYKLRKILEYEAAEVLCSDEYIADSRFIPMEELLARADIVIIGAPHNRYRDLELGEGKRMIDIWNVLGNGAMLT